MSDGVWYGESQNYSVVISHETVLLERPDVSEPLVIGNFYGNMHDAVIDPEERWCVMVGCGVIVYRLGPPWKAYTGPEWPPPELADRYSTFTSDDSGQWWQCGNISRPTLWLSTVKYLDSDRFQVEGGWEDQAEGEGPIRFEILAQSGLVRPLT
jgi:hypothetical protein